MISISKIVIVLILCVGPFGEIDQGLFIFFKCTVLTNWVFSASLFFMFVFSLQLNILPMIGFKPRTFEESDRWLKVRLT